jgi:hypothetical protein
MNVSVIRKPSQSAVLLIGILLTVAAVAAHRFLPDRRLSLDPVREGAVYFLMNFGDDEKTEADWVDQSRQHFRCRFSKDAPGGSCSYTYLLYQGEAAHQGVDLSRYRNLNLKIRYTGPAHYLRLAIRNFDPRYSKLEDTNSSKFNALNLQPKDLTRPVTINLHEFSVPEWWVAQYDLPRELAQPDLSNATAFTIYLQGEPADVDHEIQIDSIEFSGDWISAESWYLGILCLWILIGASYGTTQWLALRHTHREQRKTITQLQDEKEKFRQLSTIDGLTKVLNRHGIERFLESPQVVNLATSVIVIDLDHFKRINDQRGHYDGDRVLQAVGARAPAFRRRRTWPRSCVPASCRRLSFPKTRCRSPRASAWRPRRMAPTSTRSSARRIRRCIWPRAAAATAWWRRAMTRCTRSRARARVPGR